jgi:hypothetical protein
MMRRDVFRVCASNQYPSTLETVHHWPTRVSKREHRGRFIEDNVINADGELEEASLGLYSLQH